MSMFLPSTIPGGFLIHHKAKSLIINVGMGVSLFLAGLMICYFFGRMSYKPIDQAIIFDTAWRLLDGQVPYRDFFSPMGMTPGYFTSLFFGFLGVDWGIYLLSSSVMNGFFTVLVYYFFRSLHQNFLLSILWALGSACVFYPPVGTPYMEQTAFIFIFLALISLFCSLKSRRFLFTTSFCFAPLMLAAYLSKQNPSVYTVVALPLFLFMARDRFLRLLLGLVAGTIFTAIIFTAYVHQSQIPWENIRYYNFTLPSEIGSGRLAGQLNPFWLFHSLKRAFINASLWTPLLFVFIFSTTAVGFLRSRPLLRNLPFLFLPLAGIFSILAGLKLFFWIPVQEPHKFIILGLCFLALGLVVWLVRRHLHFPIKSLVTPRKWNAFWLALVFFFIQIFYVISANKFESNGVPFHFVILGLLFAAFDLREKNNVRNFLVGLALFDLVIFNYRINFSRITNAEVTSVQESKILSQDLPDSFKPMLWGPSEHNFLTPKYISKLMTFLKIQNRNFFFFGDNTIISGMLGKPAVNPIVVYYGGLTYGTKPSDIAFYENLCFERLQRYQAKFFVLENESTYIGTNIAEFPRLHQLIQASPMVLELGPLKVFDIEARLKELEKAL